MDKQPKSTKEKLFTEMVQTLKQLDEERILLVKNAADVLYLQQTMKKKHNRKSA